jgi:acetylxylan esterase
MFSIFKSLALLAGVVAGVHAAGPLQQQTGSWGDNPTNVGFYYYTPTSVSPNPALIVAIHYCGGTAQAFYSGTNYANLADQHGFIVIYPDAPDSGGCWDVHTSATLTHDAGGDSLAIANMVRFAISSWGVDASRVYMTGLSSGAMMTNVLAGAYPDLFEAGSAWAGVPYGCFGGPDMWNTACATGQITKSGQEWVSMIFLNTGSLFPERLFINQGDEVRTGYPGYTGSRPKLQIWQGTLLVGLIVPSKDDYLTRSYQ